MSNVYTTKKLFFEYQCKNLPLCRFKELLVAKQVGGIHPKHLYSTDLTTFNYERFP